MSTAVQTQSKALKLEAAIDRPEVGAIEVSAKHGMVITSMAQTMEFAKLMSLAREAVPKHLRENPGACLAVSIQAYEWQISPFALANKSYVVNDRLCYEAAIYHSIVLRRAPIKGRVKRTYSGEGQTRTCTVSAILLENDETVEYTSPKFSAIKVKNSPLWVGDPDLQLFYYSVRAFARAHFPDVMMGIFTADEMMDSTVVAQQVETRSKADRLLNSLPPRTVTQVNTPQDNGVSGDQRDDIIEEPEIDTQAIMDEILGTIKGSFSPDTIADMTRQANAMHKDSVLSDAHMETIKQAIRDREELGWNE